MNNIYGVDIDRQAVEVTQMSLYLKVLENENADTLNPQMTLALKEVYLPALLNNIKCGNSLIGTDFGAQGEMFGDESRMKINPFDWEMEFSDIMKNGGFDCVIGNPPYVRPQNLEDNTKEYFWGHYKTFIKKSDLYCCFIQKGIGLTKRNGLMSYIVSDGWMRLDSFENLRGYILENTKVKQLVELPDKVFEDATVKTGIFVLEKESSMQKRQQNDIQILRYNENTKGFDSFLFIQQINFLKTYKVIFDTSLNPEIAGLKGKLSNRSNNLGSLVDVRFGLKTGDDKKFIGTKEPSKKYKALLRGDDVQRYGFHYKGEYVYYVPDIMRSHRKTARPGESSRFEQPKILVKDTSAKLGGTLDYDNYYVKDVLILTPKESLTVKLEYILALINSRLIRFYYETTFPTLHVQNEELASLPIRTIDFANPTDRK